MSKTPVFDIGDTIIPDDRLMNDSVKKVVTEQGYPESEIPRFPIYSYNIFKIEELHEFLMSNNLKANPERIVEVYKEKARRWFAESEMPKFLLRCNVEFGKIGFISDNSIEEKEFMMDILRNHYIEYDGYVVSEEVGAEKPSERMFRSFLEMRDESAEDFVYFGNNARVDQGCRKVGMEFVWVSQFNTFGSSWDGKKVESLSIENIRDALEVER